MIDTVCLADITVGGSFVWVGTAIGDIIQIDPRSNSVQGIFKAKAGGYDAG
jgi:hypothetical protein